MDPQRRTLIVTGAVLLIILLIIFGTVFFLIRTILKPSGTPNPTPTSRVSLFPTASGAPGASLPGETTASPAPFNSTNQPAPASGLETFNGPVFQMQYPNSWGILTCNNSRNVELDPTSTVDQLNIACNYAQKPVTILVGQNTCVGGQIVSLGSVQVRKIVGPILTDTGGSGNQYHWCTQTSPALDITHRVGTGRAFSASDYSSQVEQVISSLKFAQ